MRTEIILYRFIVIFPRRPVLSVDIGQLVVVSLPVTLGEEPVLGLVVGVGPLGEPPAGREQ